MKLEINKNGFRLNDFFVGKVGKANRNFEGAKSTRTLKWRTNSMNINTALKYNLKRLVNASRQLQQNSGLFKGWLNDNRNQIIGSNGIRIQLKATRKDGTLDAEMNEHVETVYNDYCKSEFVTKNGQFNMVQLQWLFSDQLKRDGEITLRLHEAETNNPYLFCVEPLETDSLDYDLNTNLRNGNRIEMGIEYNAKDKPVNYYFKKSNVDDTYNYYAAPLANYEIVPASEIIHEFDKTFAKQRRGIPEAHAILNDIQRAEDFNESSIDNARVSAKTPFFIKRDPQKSAGQYSGEDISRASGNNDTTVDDNLNEHSTSVSAGDELPIASGVATVLDYGEDVIKPEAQFPHEQHSAFMEVIYSTIAKGLKTIYNFFTGNIKGVNYSGLRHANLAMRENYKADQVIPSKVVLKIFSKWLKWAILAGKVNATMLDYERINKPEAQPRGFDSADPLKDSTTDVLELKHGLTSRKRILTRKGYVQEEIDKENESDPVYKRIIESTFQIDISEQNDDEGRDPQTSRLKLISK